MAEREVKVGLASFRRADAPSDTEVFGFGLLGQTVDVHGDDLERFDRLNGPSAAPTVPLPTVAPVNELTRPEPPRSGRGSGVEAWVAYAESLDLIVPEDPSRDEVIALVDDSK